MAVSTMLVKIHPLPAGTVTFAIRRVSVAPMLVHLGRSVLRPSMADAKIHSGLVTESPTRLNGWSFHLH